MQVQNNNVSFSGLGIIGKIKTKELYKLNDFISNAANQIKISELERNYSTDIFFNTKVSKITFKHNKYGDMTNYGMSKWDVKSFAKDFDNLKKQLEKAIAAATEKI